MDKQKLRYQLREAAGSFWLLDMEQPGIPYRRPVQLNETGADIWRAYYEQGLDIPSAAKALSTDYGVSPEELEHDIDALLDQLRASGIVCGRGERCE